MSDRIDHIVTKSKLNEGEIRRAAAISLVSSSIEFYDFFLYGVAAAIIFPKIFFSGELSPLVALFASFATFAIGFLARPIGGIIFGHFGDTVGRKRALIIALVMMGASTTLIGLLPGFAQVGAWAPALLVTLRLVQGLALGGQWGGAMLLATENAPPNRRGFYGSFVQVGAPIGVILANLSLLLLSVYLPSEDFFRWGWRVPFLLSIILIGVAIYVQLYLDETPIFRELRKLQKQSSKSTSIAGQDDSKKHSPVINVIVNHSKQIILAAGTFVAVQAAFYILIAFVIAYGANREGLNVSRDTMLGAVLIASVVMLPAVMVSGALSDRLGRKPIFKIGAVGLGFWAFALFPLIDTGSFFNIVIAISIAQVFVSMMYGPQAALFAEMFGTGVRYSGASLGYQLGAVLGGGLAPMIATALLALFGSGFAISVYIAATAIVSFISISIIPETHEKELLSGALH